MIKNFELNSCSNIMEEEAHRLCERIRELTKDLDTKIEKIKETNPNFSTENIKIEIKEKKYFNRPPAGKKVPKWDNTIIDWKSSLRRPW
tara:strand:+ start:415 stop:681 length:267 start_codon:yes stop_codon:yes gene_type:complete